MAEEQTITYVDAINQAVKEEMRRDQKVVVWGVDVTGDFGVTTTLGVLEEFGPDRIRDTPIAEEAIVAMAAGAAFAGLRPIVTLMHAAFVPLAGDALFLKMGCNYQEWGYPFKLPAVVMTPISSGGMGADLALSPESILIHSPGLKVVMPSTPYDAKGLLKSAIRDDYPVIYMPHLKLYGPDNKQSIPVDEYLVPLGKADVKRQGTDITIVTYSHMVQKSLAAAEALSKEGIECEIVDLRSLVPLDINTVVASVRKTGRLLVVHEAYKRGGFAGEIIARFIEAAPELLKTMKTTLRRLATPNVSLPHTYYVEDQMIPQAETISKTVKEMVR
jgi:acetoin:2,6-dichlorophenolindophenol oxidoreductase subunit beta